MKKLITFLIAVVLTFLPAMEAAASDPVKIAGLNASYWEQDSSRAFTLSGAKATATGVISVKPGDELVLPLPPEAFSDSSGKHLSRNDFPAVYAYQLEEAKIGVKVRAETGAHLMESVSLRNESGSGGAYISLFFTESFPSVSGAAFDYIIMLSQEGQRSVVDIKLSGVLSNPVAEVSPGDGYIDLSRGTVAEAKAYIKNIYVGIGNGVTIVSNFFEGSRYYGTCTVQASLDGLPLIGAYPEVEMSYTLQTIGLRNGRRECVSLDLDSRYYVYNAEGEYVGVSDKALRYSHKYYLSKKKLDMIVLPGA